MACSGYGNGESLGLWGSVRARTGGNDARRQINGIDAIRRWAEREIIGDNVTIEPRKVTEHYGETIVRGRYDGTYDKTNLPAELIMTNYYNVVGEKVVSLTVINDRPSEY